MHLYRGQGLFPIWQKQFIHLTYRGLNIYLFSFWGAVENFILRKSVFFRHKVLSEYFSPMSVTEKICPKKTMPPLFKLNGQSLERLVYSYLSIQTCFRTIMFILHRVRLFLVWAPQGHGFLRSWLLKVMAPQGHWILMICSESKTFNLLYSMLYL